MSKKRKTRKEKERARVRHTEQVEKVQPVHIDTPTYSVSGLKTELAKPKSTKPKKEAPSTVEQKDMAYLRRDIATISAASGIIIALEVLLFVLLSSGIVKLNFLGY